jgi:periplasmic copper chaperone A
MLRSIVFATLLLAASMAASLAQSTAPSPSAPIAVENPWARATPGNSKTGAAYMTVIDRGSAPDRLVGVSSPVAARAQLHTASNENGVMKMRQVDGIPLEPGKPIELKPGGYHVMLVDLKQPLKEGDRFPLTLTFEKAGSVAVTVTVQKAGAGAPMPGMKM